MKIKNTPLHEAKRAKADEFYTRYEDIEAEVAAYVAHDPNVFRGKTVLLPCDDWEHSEFVRYFHEHFEEYGLARLIATCWIEGGRGKYLDRTAHGTITGLLDGDGDFRSDEVSAYRARADMVITNPPFSLFREFLAWVVAEGKKFLLLGNMNAITYQKVWPLIQSNGLWLGTRHVKEFTRPDGTAQTFGNIIWYTDIDHGKRHEPLMLTESCDPARYQRYDNYDAIEVPKVKSIPSDYSGVMGVPISFLDKYCPEQFEIVGCSYDYGRPDGWPKDVKMSPVINGRNIYKRIFIKHRAAVAEDA